MNTFKINITNEFKLQCSLIDSEDKEQFISLHNNQQQEYTPCISFHNNIISICEENKENNIYFIEDFIQNPDTDQYYSIIFQNKQYSLIAEVLFSIIIDEFKQKIEKQFIIHETIVQIPSRDSLLSDRMRSSLEAIGLKNIYINSSTFDYTLQGQYLHELIQKKTQMTKLQKKLNKAKELYPKGSDKINQIIISQYDDLSEELIEREIIKLFDTKERTQMKLTTLDNYCLFISSRYLETLEDHQNFTKVTKRLERNMEKFHYNPISVTEKTIDFFPNVETHHIYKENDCYLKGGRVIQYVDWKRIGLYESKEIQERNKEKKIEFKGLSWTKNDVKKEQKKLNPQQSWKETINIQIPNGIQEIENGAFDEFGWLIRSIKIPESVKYLPHHCFDKCKILKQLILPETLIHIDNDAFIHLDELQELTISSWFKVNGNLLSIVNDECLYSVQLPRKIQFVYNNQTNHICVKSIDPLISYSIPSNVTKLSDYCFANSHSLKQLEGIDQIKEFGKCCFSPRMKDILEPLNLSKEEKLFIMYGLKQSEINQLEEWTNLSLDTILFDSIIDNWSENDSDLNDKIIGKKQLIFLIEDEKNEKFGLYLNTEIEDHYRRQTTDFQSFHFNLESNRRLLFPCVFDIIDTSYALRLKRENDSQLIQIGDIYLYKDISKDESFCEENYDHFKYYGIGNALCGNEKFIPKRILVIQMN